MINYPRLFKGRKGQGPGQVLVYAMSIILISLIMVFGYKAIGMFVGQSGQIAKIQFASDFKSALQNMDYGDLEIKTFSIPSDYKMICLTSNYENVRKPAEDEDIYDANSRSEQINPLVRAQWMETDNNAFLVSGIDSFYAFKVRKLHLDTNANGIDDDQPDGDSGMSHICIPTNGKFTLKMESMGKYIFISSKASKSTV